MDRLRNLFQRRTAQTYTPLDGEDGHEDDDTTLLSSSATSSTILSPRIQSHRQPGKPESWFDYAVFLLLGVAMLWAWNCFLAAAAYFQMRFRDNPQILNNFQSAIMSLSTLTTLITTNLLSSLQRVANYPFRIRHALLLNIVVFTLLALSTVLFTHVNSTVYLAFVLLMVFGTSVAAGFFQNGLFAFMSSFDPIYAQAVMSGQGVAGVLPAIVQIVSVLATFSRRETTDENGDGGREMPEASPKSAFAYFITATGISALALFFFAILLSRHPHHGTVAAKADIVEELSDPNSSINAADSTPNDDTNETPPDHRKPIPYRKLPLPAYAIFITFAITMIFPVFTQAITSSTSSSTSLLSRPEIFIPLSFLFWNSGDLLGRISCAFPKLTCNSPPLLAIFTTLRVLYIPLYLLCNIKSRGATVGEGSIWGDVFYWFIQVTFGLTNGWLGSNILMTAPGLVEEDEREVTGGFMGLCLVAGLTVGSFASFALVASI